MAFELAVTKALHGLSQCLEDLDKIAQGVRTSDDLELAYGRLTRWKQAAVRAIAVTIDKSEADNFAKVQMNTSRIGDPLGNLEDRLRRYAAHLQALSEDIQREPRHYFNTATAESEQESLDPDHDISLICESGHVITSYLNRIPTLGKISFCDVCGEPTIRNCTKCGALIRGAWRVEQSKEELSAHSLGDYRPPNFCWQCGTAFPWISSAMQLAVEAVAADLTPAEAEEFRENLEELLKQTPRAQSLTTRFKQLWSKLRAPAADSIKNIFVEVASETLKRVILQPN
jgi:hypothetical protein